MKNILFLIFLILFVCSASAQNNSFDSRLLSKFSKNELNEMQSKSPETFLYWNFYAANAYQVMDLPNEKSNAHEIKGIVKISDMNNINVFELNYVPVKKDYQYYRIEGTTKLLVILSEEQIKATHLRGIKSTK